MKTVNKYFKNMKLSTKLTIITFMTIISTSFILTNSSIYTANNIINDIQRDIIGSHDEAKNVYEAKINEKKEETGGVGNILIDEKIEYEAKNKFTYLSYFYMMIVIMLGCLISYLLSKKALAPVEKLREEIKDINQHNLSKRIQVESMNEVGDLSESFNFMLDKIEGAFKNQKQFSANVSHELRTPLASIISNIEVLEMDDEPSKKDYKETIDIIKGNSNRLLGILNNLSAISSDNDIELNEEISLKELFLNIIDELKESIESKNICIDCSDLGYRIIGNEILIYRALFNLVDNCVKYHKYDGSINISAINKDDKITITIEDDGYGIEESELPNIFEPFYRVDKCRSKYIKGSGLGLSIVDSIIKKHNGTIDINSKVNVGTIITINFDGYK
ncbi:sensor histidine kinase [Clostridium sp.]|uniref:sensor histidine kinase n=2 Tax=Clostridia TaxID=186801 RepID=UPI003F2E0CEF